MSESALIRTIRTATVQLASGDNVLAAANTIASHEEIYLQVIYIERTNQTTDVTIIVKNTAASPVEILPRITLNSDKGAVWLEFDEIAYRQTRIRCGAGEGLVVNASVGNAANVWAQYRVANASGAL